VILFVLVYILITRIVITPVQKIRQAIDRIKDGNPDQVISLQSSDEIGRLGRSFNKMSQNLKTTIAAMIDERTNLATVLFSLTDSVIMTDADERILLANPAAENLFNFKEINIVGHTLIEAIHDYEIHEVVKKSILTAHEQNAQLETAGRYTRVVVVPISPGHSAATLILIQDLTELRNLQTMRRELIGNISHDLRTPIAGIKAMVETLQDGALQNKKIATDFLTKIDSEVDRLTQMVSELTELSRIESGKAELKMEPLNINLLIEEVVVQMNPLAESKPVVLTTNLETSLPIMKADKERIRQTLINLINNAIKYNNPGGKVIVSTTHDEKSITVNVSDTGVGISKEDLPHIFERFYKADKARTKGGSGLGLAIAKHTIQAHGGEISAKSEESKGAVLSFTLPLSHNNLIIPQDFKKY
jgi:two-component system phosphate regulon sensor histidine kinase PhoR